MAFDFGEFLQMVNRGEIAKDSPMGLLGMLNSDSVVDRTYAVERLLGTPDKIKVVDDKGRWETEDLYQALTREHDKRHYGWWLAYRYGVTL